MSDAAFTIKYDGPAMAGRRMAVRDLAPALLALGDAVNAASRIANPYQRPPALAIAATEPGSFVVNLDLVDAGRILSKIQDFLTSDEVAATVNASELVGLVIVAVGGVKWLYGRKIRAVDDPPESGMIRLTDERGDSITLPSQAVQLMQDAEFRLAAQEVVEPLHEGMVDEVEIKHGALSVEVAAEERRAFDVPSAVDELVVDEERIVLVRLTSIAFQEGNKWKVTEGDLTYWVSIVDDAFLRRVTEGAEQFGSGDSLRVRMHTRQWDTPEGPKAERTILEVLEHRHGARQVPLPFADDE